MMDQGGQDGLSRQTRRGGRTAGRGKGRIMELTQARADLLALQEKLSAYSHALGLLSYDGETTAPRGTAGNRAHATGILTAEVYCCEIYLARHIIL